MITPLQITDILRKFSLPGSSSNIVDEGLLSSPFISDGESGKKIVLSLTVPSSKAEGLESLRTTIESAIKSLDGVESAMVALTAQRDPSESPPPPPQQQRSPNVSLDGVNHIIAVASGKGGVGKSTTALNLALGLRNQGLKVGILDADIYGPSLPRLLALDSKPEVNGRILTPLEKYGIKVMSIGFLVAEESPVIWRGPMVISALTQLLREVAWAPLDILVVDMPPGTGDAQLTMSQQVPLSGAIIVSTPQDLALIDARKGLNMFTKVSVPILGIVENMSSFECPKCGERTDLFGHGGAMAEAEKLKVPFLGAVPLHLDIRCASDLGLPLLESDPEGSHAILYNEIARKVSLALSTTSTDGPKIVFE